MSNLMQRAIIVLLATTATATATAADDLIMDSGLPLFADSDVLSITIEGPISTLIRERNDEEYNDGLLRYTADDGTEHELDLRFRARGNFRRRRETCLFPPVRLNLKKKQVEGTVFEGQNILKLVTHCRPGSDRYEQYPIREELAYKILNMHTPYSFRSRLLRVTWVDTEDDNKADERYGFVLEHKNELEDRTNMKEPGLERASYDDLNAHQAAVTALFEYLIGNTDFSMIAGPAGEACCHNGLLLREVEDSDIFFVPYDFDMGGIVDAPYAEPNPRFGLRSVTERLYRGHCRFNPDMEAARAVYLENQPAVMKLIEEQPGLDNRNRKRVQRFLENFYDVIGNDKKFEREILDRCIG
jgi:hypothetical protein